MTSTTHTPGPWHVTPIEGKPAFNIRAGAESLAMVYAWIGSIVTNDRHGEGQANARLIAAAPLMLEALENFVRLDKSSPRDKGGNRVFVDVRDWEAFLARARAAIEAATKGE